MSGHIRRRGNNSWELKFDLGTDPLSGKRLTRYHSFKGTRREAEKKLAELITAADKGEYVDPSKLTVGEFIDKWVTDWAAHNVSRNTLKRYQELLDDQVRRNIGSAKLQKIKPVHLNALYRKLLTEGRKKVHSGDGGSASEAKPTGLSARTVGHVHRVLHRALGHAVTWGLLTANPADAVEPPRVEAAELEILTEEQARTVLQRLRGRSIYPIVMLALATGMRRGELLALRWRDVDLDAARLRVEQSLEQVKQEVRFKAPKTKHGRRTITLPSYVVAELRAELEKCKRAVAGVPDGSEVDLSLVKLPPDALVFPNWDGGPRRPNAVTARWRQSVKGLGLPKVTLHALRHTHASQLIASGMDVLTISRRLGHSSPSITLGVYGHLFTNTDDRAAAVIETAFGSAFNE